MKTALGIATLLLFTGCSADGRAGTDQDIVIAGAIRPDANGRWSLIEDDAHRPRGVESVETEPNGNVVIHYSEEGSAVVTFVTTPDETLAGAGVVVGASAGLDRAILTLSSRPDYAEVGDYANVWFYGVMEP